MLMIYSAVGEVMITALTHNDNRRTSQNVQMIRTPHATKVSPPVYYSLIYERKFRVSR